MKKYLFVLISLTLIDILYTQSFSKLRGFEGKWNLFLSIKNSELYSNT